MTHRIVRISLLGIAVLMLGGWTAAENAPLPDCSTVPETEQVACLTKTIGRLQEKMTELEKETLKWNDRIALRNEDMRLFPRCLDNPGPNSPDVSAIYATSCAKTPAQTWMIAKPYGKGQ